MSDILKREVTIDQWIEIPLASIQTGNNNRTVGIYEKEDRIYIKYGGKSSPFRSGRKLTEIEKALAREVFELRRKNKSPG